MAVLMETELYEEDERALLQYMGQEESTTVGEMYVADFETCDSDDFYKLTEREEIYKQRVTGRS